MKEKFYLLSNISPRQRISCRSKEEEEKKKTRSTSIPFLPLSRPIDIVPQSGLQMELFDFRLVAGSPLGIEILTRVVTIFLIRYTRSEDIKSRNLLKAEICSCVPWTVTLSTLYCFFFFFFTNQRSAHGSFPYAIAEFKVSTEAKSRRVASRWPLHSLEEFNSLA